MSTKRGSEADAEAHAEGRASKRKKRYRKEAQRSAHAILRWQSKTCEARKQQQMLPRGAQTMRRRIAWKKSDRECLRRALLHYGFERWERVHAFMNEGLKTMEHSRQDVVDASMSFCKACVPHVQGKERAYLLDEVLQAHPEAIDVPTAKEWHKADALAVSWTRRLRLLRGIRQSRDLLEGEKTRGEAMEHLKRMPETSAPTWWWDHRADVALVLGIFEHGYGQYEAVKESKRFQDLFLEIQSGKIGKEDASSSVPNAEKNVMSRMGHSIECTCVVCTQQKKKASEAMERKDERMETDIDQDGVLVEEKMDVMEPSASESKPEQDKDKTLDWPVPDTLTRRLKRVVDHLTKLMNKTSKNKGRGRGKGSSQSTKSDTWTKKEKMDLVRALMTFGLQPNFKAKGLPPHWGLLKEQANLSKSTSSIKECYMGLIIEAEKALESGKNTQPKPSTHLPTCTCVICTQKRVKASKAREETGGETGELDEEQARDTQEQVTPQVEEPQENEAGIQAEKEGQSGAPRGLFTNITATRLKERLETVGILSRALHFISSEVEWETVLPSWRGQDLPTWWQEGVHDYALAKGLLKHGFGNWELIAMDESLGFRDIFCGTQDHHQGVQESGAPQEEEEIAPPDEKGAASSVPGQVELPTPKFWQRRLKFLAKSFRRILRKASKNPGMLTKPVSRTPHKPKVPPSKMRSKRSRTKYAKRTDIPRGEDGKPILPLTITDKLYLIALGHIVHDRPGFHNDRHIFPAGLITRREHYSFVHPTARTYYTSEILDQGGEGPIFRVVADDAPTEVIERDTASGAWVEVSLRCHHLRGSQRNKVTVSGTEMFGLSHPDIAALVLELPGVEKCERFQRFLSFARTEDGAELVPMQEDKVVLGDDDTEQRTGSEEAVEPTPPTGSQMDDGQSDSEKTEDVG